MGRIPFATGDNKMGLRYVQGASQLGYDDAGILCAATIFFSDQGLFDLARESLSKAPVNPKKFALLIENNWGCFYYKEGEYDRAVDAFKKAVAGNPENVVYSKNLALALTGAGKEEEAAQIMKKA